ncbi:histidine phosphatase family protein [Paenibacillus glycinis]|uniref:Histidine phosphatase family protein n=1 Tax=Paenibacillus glycinis TaxID=2697035 RepID=A0ABW9XRW5_9BACL|nr:histidine phosphatase family protein [Paenibacillus glycinis]NBD25404.1 histidine phosphatase family protein [Paenibacillus glycinis]
MKTIYLIRHCKAKGQEPDAELTLEGVAQAKSLSLFLLDKQIELIISSPFLRAVHSIKPFSELTNLSVNIDSRLSERVLSSVAMADWMDRLRESFHDTDLKLQGGESSSEAARRGMAVINELMDGGEHTIAVVSHGNLLALMIRNFKKDFGFDDWLAMKNPDVYELVLDTDKHSVKRIWK